MRHIGKIVKVIPKRRLVIEVLPEYEETSKNPKAIMQYVNSNDFLESHSELREQFVKWYYSVGIGMVSVKRVRELLNSLYKSTDKDVVKMEASIGVSIQNRWLAFYDWVDYNIPEIEENEDEVLDIGF